MCSLLLCIVSAGWCG
ncbi:hypothetical protein MZB74_25165 [Escherichia coli]|uniref:Uncharacterized protein n=1 Tax=Escherichia coli TaxID=562 RepID=A0AAP3A292_ECOLX|nr:MULTISPECIES: hypothetical protein [Enterobacteriaceae]MCC9667198.1 hypothetical protein [Escherichia coli]MCD6754371.1 hypothetical protein [Escherichia coli]MCD9236256.1 hypothetical protein [Escherichia coli]MCD9241018.1 hypothetical protein [Escherichia coli]MCD9317095.1 hypothetical protein [Escherichia coli]